MAEDYTPPSDAIAPLSSPLLDQLWRSITDQDLQITHLEQELGAIRRLAEADTMSAEDALAAIRAVLDEGPSE